MLPSQILLFPVRLLLSHLLDFLHEVTSFPVIASSTLLPLFATLSHLFVSFLLCLNPHLAASSIKSTPFFFPQNPVPPGEVTNQPHSEGYILRRPHLKANTSLLPRIHNP
jgi:hypothetical protein